MNQPLIVIGVVVAAFIGVMYLVNQFLRPFYWRIFASLVPLIIAALIVTTASIHYVTGQEGLKFKFGVDLVGGTILVYEIDLDKFPDGKIPATYKPEDLVASLKRRIDPADLYNVTIRPVSNTRVEIILPTGGKHQMEAMQRDWQELVAEVSRQWEPPAGKTYSVDAGQREALIQQVKEYHQDVDVTAINKFVSDHYKVSKEKKQLTAEEVQNIKELISRVGSLEFRILANEHDDRDALETARKYFQDAKTPERQRELETRAFMHQPPPAPRPPDGEGFVVKLGDQPSKHTYSWVELGRLERQSLGLSNVMEGKAEPGSNWKRVEDARNKGEPLTLQMNPREDPVGAEVLIYSRKVVNEASLAEKDRGKRYEYFVLTRDPEKDKAVTGKYLVNADQTMDRRGGLAVGFHFNQQGGMLFGDLTARNAPEKEGQGGFRRYLAIILDNQIESAPRLNARITTDGVIEGNFSKVEVDRLVRILRAGQLPATLKPQPVSENTMGATLGEDTISKGTRAVGLAFLFVLAFMVVYYRFAGFVASVALLANLLLTVGFMVAVNATFTLPGLAGLVLMLGMAVDANVLIYERLREERDRGASLPLAIRNGYDRAFPTIIDTHLSSIFTAIVLYAVGNDQLKGFGVSLAAGLVISLFTSLFMTRLMFDIWQSKNWLHKLSMLRMFTTPNIDFMSIRYYWFTATILLTIFGISVFIGRLPQDLNIDFNGGTAYGGQLAKKMPIAQLRAQLHEDNQKKLLRVVDAKEVPGSDGLAYDITYLNPDGAQTTRTIHFPNRPGEGEGGKVKTAEERLEIVKKRASELPDVSVEQIFQGFAGGDESELFTVRTSEKAPELVQASIVRLLGDELKRIRMSFEVVKPGREAVLTFTDPTTKEPAFASPTQVTVLLERETKALKVQTPFALKPEGDSHEGRYQKLTLMLNEPGISAEQLQKVLEETRKEFDERPQPDRLENFDSQLAKETQLRAMYAILASWGAILMYLWFRFGSWTFGLAAVVCLIHDLFFTLGIVAFCHYIDIYTPGLARALLIQDFKIDLPAVAALLTLVGYSVNDTIVVFDRIREVRGKNPDLTPQMINDSVNQTLSRTLLASFTTWLVVFVLYVAGGEGVHLFGFVMVVGVIVGTYSSIYIASPLLLMFGEGSSSSGERERLTQPAEVPA